MRSFEKSRTVHSAIQRHITEDFNHNKRLCDNLIPRNILRVILVKRVDDIGYAGHKKIRYRVVSIVVQDPEVIDPLKPESN